MLSQEFRTQIQSECGPGMRSGPRGRQKVDPDGKIGLKGRRKVDPDGKISLEDLQKAEPDGKIGLQSRQKHDLDGKVVRRSVWNLVSKIGLYDRQKVVDGKIKIGW